MECHRGYQRNSPLNGEAQTLVISILFHPPLVQSSRKWFNVPILSDFRCNDVYIFLLPDGAKDYEERYEEEDELVVGGPPFVTGILYKLAKRSNVFVAPDRRLVFVGTETWEHAWLTRRVLLHYESLDYEVYDSALNDTNAENILVEGCHPGADIPACVRWWLCAIAEELLGADQSSQLNGAMSFMSLKDFKNTFDDDTIPPLVCSLTEEDRQERRDYGPR